MASDDDVAAASGEHGSTVWHALVCQARDGLSAMTKLSAESLARAGATMPDARHTGESMFGAPQPAHALGRPPDATPSELETAPPTHPTRSPGTDSGCVPQVPPTRIIRKEKTHSSQRQNPSSARGEGQSVHTSFRTPHLTFPAPHLLFPALHLSFRAQSRNLKNAERNQTPVPPHWIPAKVGMTGSRSTPVCSDLLSGGGGLCRRRVLLS